jgi:hypothetical protein
MMSSSAPLTDEDVNAIICNRSKLRIAYERKKQSWSNVSNASSRCALIELLPLSFR